MGEADTNRIDRAKQIRRGNHSAFKRLFDAHYNALCEYACRYVTSLEVAEDLVQEVFFDLWKRRRSWRPKHSPKAFLYGAVRNQALKQRRRSSKHSDNHVERTLQNIPSRETPARSLRNQELTNMAQKAIAELPERRRHIFILSREHGLTYVEIATILDISVKTVETQMGRALQHLRNQLSGVYR